MLGVGTYRLTAYAKSSADWNGVPQLLHARACVTSGNHPAISPTGPGAWPAAASTW